MVLRQDMTQPDWWARSRTRELSLATRNVYRGQHQEPVLHLAETQNMNSAQETEILNKYNLSTLYPATWPDEKNEADEDDDLEEPPAPRPTFHAIRRSKSRFSVLEDRSRFSRLVPGAERTKDGVDNLVQKDEQDPLGMYPSVVQVLRARNVPVEEDIKLRMSKRRPFKRLHI